MPCFNHLNNRDFIREVRRMRCWYQQGRQTSRRRRGINRTYQQGPRVRGRTRVWNAKLKGEYRRLVKPLCLRGLFKWRRCALAIRRAGLSVQSGTIPVERHWSQFITLFPPATKRVSLEVFELFAGLAMLRFNWVHYHKPWCPPWACSDTLLQQKADAVLESEGMAALQKELTEICTAAVSDLPLTGRRGSWVGGHPRHGSSGTGHQAVVA